MGGVSAGSSDRADRARARAGLNDLVWEVSTYIEAMGERALRDTPLTLAASGMLCLIADEPGITIAEISRRVPKSAQALGQVAGRLRKLGLLERRLGDGPGVGLHVTAAGRELAEIAIDRERDLTAQLHEALGRRRYDLLTELLADSRDILKQLDAPTG